MINDVEYVVGEKVFCFLGKCIWFGVIIIFGIFIDSDCYDWFILEIFYVYVVEVS